MMEELQSLLLHFLHLLNLQPFLKSLDYAQTLPAIPQLAQVQSIASEQMQGALAGTSSMDDAMKATVTKANELLSLN